MDEGAKFRPGVAGLNGLHNTPEAGMKEGRRRYNRSVWERQKGIIRNNLAAAGKTKASLFKAAAVIKNFFFSAPRFFKRRIYGLKTN